MAVLSPSSETVSGSGFTPNATVAINIYSPSGTIVAKQAAAASSAGTISAVVPAGAITPLIGQSPGTYTGYLQAVDPFIGKSNKVNISITYTAATPAISLSAISFTYTA